MPLPEQPKPSFFRSVISGITGFFKGMLAGGVTGALGGAVLGAGILLGLAALGPGIAASGGALAIMGGGAKVGAWIGGIALASIGTTAGLVTGVIKSREAAQPSAGALVNALSMAHQHGEMVGQQEVVQKLMEAQQHEHAHRGKHGKWSKKVAVEEQASTALAQATVH